MKQIRKADGRIRKLSGKHWIVKILTGLGTCMLAATAGCGSASGQTGADGKTEFRSFQLSDSTQELTGPYQGEADYGEIAVTDAFRLSYGEFALKLLLESREKAGENPMVSPLSVMTALEMTRSGARGETEEQMREVLYGEGQGEAGQELMAYLTGLPSQEEARFHFANSIWFADGDTSFQVNEDFLKNSAKAYGAEIFAAPFDESTLHDINGWVGHKTEGMIPEILDEIPEDAVMYLINGVAFDARWQEPYTTAQVHEGEFFTAVGESQRVKMMYSEEGFLLEDENAKGFLKPYAKGYAFAALLPEEGVSLDTYLEGLTGEELMRILAQPRQTTVETGMPGFSAEMKLDMKEVLKVLGMPLAFDPDQADFTGMGQSSRGNIFMDRVIHSSFIQVDEQGTRAGAATAVEMDEESAAEVMERVILNRPFLYAIMDTEKQIPIFLGIMESADEN